MVGSQTWGRKPRILCLHGFRTSGEILKKMMGKWPDSVLEKFDFDFLDAPFPARGKSDVEALYDPPYYEWYQVNEVECVNFEECIAYIEDYMIKHGPFDGLLGFSQGAMLASVVPPMQREGVAFTKVPKIKFVIIISGFGLRELKSGPPKLLENAYSVPIECLSLHLIVKFLGIEYRMQGTFVVKLIGKTARNLNLCHSDSSVSVRYVYVFDTGDKDFLKERGFKLLKSFVNPFVIHHSMGHTVPKLDEKGVETMHKFIEKIQDMFSPDAQIALKAAL